MSETLLSKAKRLTLRRVTKPISDEEMELAIAWARGEISNPQVLKIMKYSQAQLYCLMSRAFVQLVYEMDRPDERKKG